MFSKQVTIYIIHGRPITTFPELLDINGSIVYTNTYRDHITRIVNTWDDIDIYFPEDKQTGSIPNDRLHYIDFKYYILLDDKLIRVEPPISGFTWTARDIKDYHEKNEK